MKAACVLVPHFPFMAEIQRRPELRERMVLIVRIEGSRRTIADFSPDLPGVQAGMPLQKALASTRDALLLEADDVYYQSLFDDILESLEQRSPVVEPAGLGCAYVALDGLEPLYGGDARLILTLQDAVPAHFGARVGIGKGRFVAYVAALSAQPGSAVKVPDDTEHFLREFSVDVLPVIFKTRSRLHEFALHTLGDIANLGICPLQAQFGPEGRLLWELSHGKDKCPLSPRKADEAISESLTFAAPVATMEGILLGVEALLRKAFLRPELRSRYTRLAILQAQVYRRALWVKRVTFKEPVGNRHQAMSRIKSALEGTTLPGPLEDLALTLAGLTGEAGRQGSLFSDARKKGQLNEAIKQLAVVLGKPAPIFQVREMEPWSRMPERRHALIRFSP